MRNSAYTIFVFLILFTNFTMEADTFFSGEAFGRAYGFPVLWCATGSTSLARVVYVPGLLVDILLYLVIGAVISRLWLDYIGLTGLRPMAGLCVFMIVGSGAIFFGANFLLGFVHPEFNLSPDTLGDSFISKRFHIGPY